MATDEDPNSSVSSDVSVAIDAAVAAVNAAMAGEAEAAAAGGCSSSAPPPVEAGKVKGPWSPNEDVILGQLVGKFGARNWSLIARGVPGRSGKSCRLRWCNQLDPAVKRKPFTHEEDRIIINAHATHGNKWAVIAKLLPGRTDNAIKNHWNSTLRRRCDSVKFGEDFSIDNKHKASSEETLSGDLSSLKANTEENQTACFMEAQPYQSENLTNLSCVQQPVLFIPEAIFNPPLPRPIARIGAFNVCSKTDSSLQRLVPVKGPLVQAFQPDFGISRFIEGVDNEPTIPSKCGHGCCSGETAAKPESSLLGPNFVDYEESPAFSSYELASIATHLNTLAWSKSGLETRLARTMDYASVHTPSSQAAMNAGTPGFQNSNLQFEGHDKMTGLVAEGISTQTSRGRNAFPAEVEGLS